MVFWTDENATNESSTDEIPGADSGSEELRPDEHGGHDPATDESPDEGTSDEAAAVTVGVCSECGASLPRPNVVIEYETGGEWEQVALCPECQTLAVA
jgi:hypothetical protein